MGHSLLIVETLWSNICVHLYCPWLLLCHGFSQQSFLRCQNQCQEPDCLGMCHKYGVSMQIVSQLTLRCKVSTFQYPEYKSAEMGVYKTIFQWKERITEQQSKSWDCRSRVLVQLKLVCTWIHNLWVTPLVLSVPLWTPIPCLNCWDGISKCPYLFVYYLFAVTSKSGRKSEGAVGQSLLDTIQISWIVQAYFIVTCSKIHPWKSCGVGISSSWFGFHSCSWKF